MRERITSPKLWRLFESAAGRQAGLPTVICWRQSHTWKAGASQTLKVPAGPKGIMQIAAATARTMGLRMVYATRYRVSTQRTLVKRKKGKPVWKTVKRKVPYSVLVRDERMCP